MPERLIGADPDAFFDVHARGLGLGRAAGRYPDALMAPWAPRVTGRDLDTSHFVVEDEPEEVAREPVAFLAS